MIVACAAAAGHQIRPAQISATGSAVACPEIHKRDEKHAKKNDVGDFPASYTEFGELINYVHTVRTS